jgi:uncharacterized membrane protein
MTAPNTPPPTTAAVASPPVDAEREARDLATLRDLEARAAVGTELGDAEIAALVRFVDEAPSPRARALAAAVLPWLDPTVAFAPLARAARDTDARVRAAAGQSLVALARRLSSEQGPDALNVALVLLDDPQDEVACVGAELFALLDAPGSRAAFESRADNANDVRVACYVRFGGLPLRTVYMPPLPPEPAAESAPSSAPSSTSPSAPAEAGPQWLAIATATGAGLLAGSAFPVALVPSRDVLLYAERESKLSREEVSVATQLGAGLLGAALLGGGVWGGERLFGRLSDTAALTFAGATGAGATVGAGLGLALGADDGGQALALSLGTLAGVATGATVAWAGAPTDDDNALILAAAATGALSTSLGAFTVLPVGVDDVFGVPRNDFGLGAGLAGAGVFGLAAVAAAPFVDVSSGRAAAIAAGGLVGGGALTALAFLVVPADLNVRSRIACGLGLGGQVLGATAAGLLIPEAWLVDAAATVAVAGTPVVVRAPNIAAFAPLPGRAELPLGVVVDGRF